MKIDSINMKQMLKTYKVNQTPKTEGLKVESKLDQVSVSEDALSFSAIFSELKSQLEVRTPEEQAHIKAVAQLIKNDEYQVKPTDVAEKMLENIFLKRP